MTMLTMMITLMLKPMTGVYDRPSTDYVDVETDDNGNSGVDDRPSTGYINVETDDNGNSVLMTDLSLITLTSKLMTMTMQNAGVDDRPGTQPRDWILPCSTGLPKDDRSRP